jgi:1-acyl-sn-glycerol-3-phosphate acyltransferase
MIPSTTESPITRWRRRAISLGIVFGGFVVLTLLLPLALPLALGADLVRRRRCALARSLLMLEWVFFWEIFGILGTAFLAISGRLPLWSGERQRRSLYTLQRVWAVGHFRAGCRLFGLELHREAPREIGPGPFLVLVRHSSLADAVLTASEVLGHHRLELRWLAKKELLWQPCIDLMGNQLPNLFVQRIGASKSEVRAVAALAQGVGPGQGVLLYPEGTRFSREKLERAVARLEQRRPQAAVAARGLRHTLPPRPAGTLALLEAMPTADVLVFVHAGFEKASSAAAGLTGGLDGLRVDTALWHIPRAEVPSSNEERQIWLAELWQRVDDWIDGRLAEQRSAKGSDPR